MCSNYVNEIVKILSILLLELLEFFLCSIMLNVVHLDKEPFKDKYPNFEVGLKCIIMVF